MNRPCYSGPRPAHPPCSPDGSRARTENHLARLYTAILAELVGATGRVTAIEFDGELAARVTANFAQTPCRRGARRWHANRVRTRRIKDEGGHGRERIWRPPVPSLRPLSER